MNTLYLKWALTSITLKHGSRWIYWFLFRSGTRPLWTLMSVWNGLSPPSWPPSHQLICWASSPIRTQVRLASIVWLDNQNFWTVRSESDDRIIWLCCHLPFVGNETRNNEILSVWILYIYRPIFIISPWIWALVFFINIYISFRNKCIVLSLLSYFV